MSSKNAYEIRLEVLTLAQNLESEKAFRKNESLQQDWHAAARFAESKQELPPAHPKLTVAQAEDVVATAKYLLGFIEEARSFKSDRL